MTRMVFPESSMSLGNLFFPMRWHGKVCGPKRLLAPLMDSKEYTIDRPFSVEYPGIRCPLFYALTNRVVEFPLRDKKSTLHQYQGCESRTVPAGTGRYVPDFNKNGKVTYRYRPVLNSGKYQAVPAFPGNTGRYRGTGGSGREIADGIFYHLRSTSRRNQAEPQ